MQQQLVTLDARERKRLYDRVQAIVAENVPFVFLATPHILVGARSDLGNFQPAVLDHYTLWNVDQLYFTGSVAPGQRAGGSR
jgi:ABC-type transport system substrate-binding protein